MKNTHVKQQLVFLQVIVSVHIFYHIFDVHKLSLVHLLIHVLAFLCIYHCVGFMNSCFHVSNTLNFWFLITISIYVECH